MTQILACLCCQGCLSSDTPFYDVQEVVEDSRILGRYECQQVRLSAVVTAQKSGGAPYLVRLEGEGDAADKGGFSEYDATLFKMGKMTYLDLYFAREENPLTQDRKGYPTTSFFLKQVAHRPFGIGGLVRKKLHVIFRIEIENEGLAVRCFNSRENADNPLVNHAAISARPNGRGLVVDPKNAALRAILAGGDHAGLFDFNTLHLKRTT